MKLFLIYLLKVTPPVVVFLGLGWVIPWSLDRLSSVDEPTGWRLVLHVLVFGAGGVTALFCFAAATKLTIDLLTHGEQLPPSPPDADRRRDRGRKPPSFLSK